MDSYASLTARPLPFPLPSPVLLPLSLPFPLPLPIQLSCLAWIPRGAAKRNPDLHDGVSPEELAALEAAMSRTALSDGEEQETEAHEMGEEEHKDDQSKKNKHGGAKKSSSGRRKLRVSDLIGPDSLKLSKSKNKSKKGGDDSEESEASGSDAEGTEAREGEDILKALRMDEYDDDEEEDDDAEDEEGEEKEEEEEDAEEARANRRAMRKLVARVGVRDVLDGDSDSDADDALEASPDHEDEEDYEEQQISPQQSCILAGTTSEDQSVMEVYAFHEKTSNLYVHHEFLLAGPPLCVTWLNAHPRPHLDEAGTAVTTGSFAAVGTFGSPGIELWDCDVLNPVAATVTLGGFTTADAPDADPEAAQLALAAEAAQLTQAAGNSKAAKKRRKQREAMRGKSRVLRTGSHTASVLSLAWHPEEPSRLASGSEDRSVKLWDVTTQQCVGTVHLPGMVQSMEWHPQFPHLLLCGFNAPEPPPDAAGAAAGAKKKKKKKKSKQAGGKGADAGAAEAEAEAEVEAEAAAASCGVAVMDMSDPAAPQLVTMISTASNAESVRWNPAGTSEFFTASEDGVLTCFDFANEAEPLRFAFQAHDHSVTAFAFSPRIGSLLATASEDGNVKVWDLSAASAESPPVLLASRHLRAGRLFTLAFDVSSPYILAAGGSEGFVVVWDVMENAAVNERFREVVEGMGFESQELPREHIELQLRGEQAPAIGPGRATNAEHRDDARPFAFEAEDENDSDDSDDSDDDEDAARRGRGRSRREDKGRWME